MFADDAAVLDGFPGVRGGIVVARGVVNVPSSAGLAAAFVAEQQRVRTELGERSLAAEHLPGVNIDTAELGPSRPAYQGE